MVAPDSPEGGPSHVRPLPTRRVRASRRARALKAPMARPRTGHSGDSREGASSEAHQTASGDDSSDAEALAAAKQWPPPRRTTHARVWLPQLANRQSHRRRLKR